jgi:hypothetical protein
MMHVCDDLCRLIVIVGLQKMEEVTLLYECMVGAGGAQKRKRLQRTDAVTAACCNLSHQHRSLSLDKHEEGRTRQMM